MTKKYAGNKGLEYYKSYPRDFFEGTLGMDGQLRGFYRMVIDLIYLHDGFLLADWGHISGNTGYGKARCKRMMQSLIDANKIQLSGEKDEFFTQKRAKNELKTSRKFQENQQKRIAKRWENKDLAEHSVLPPQDHKTTRPQDLKKYNKKNPNSDKPKKPQKISARQQIVGILCKYATPDAAKSFSAYRTGLKKPLTATAAKRIATQLEKVLHGGGDPDDALGMCEERGWQGIKAEWYFSERERENGKFNNGNKFGNGQPYQNGASGAHAGLIAGFAANADLYRSDEDAVNEGDILPN